MSKMVLMDCDTGIDDAIALLYLSKHPCAELVAVTTVAGNVGADQAARNTAAVLAHAGRRDVTIAVGAREPLGGGDDGRATGVHGSNGIGDVTLPLAEERVSAEHAAQAIARLARAHRGRLDVVATGPLTNLALALRLEPEVATWVRSVTVMGGAALVPGNVSATAEFNIARDPQAAAVVLGAAWPVTLVPLDVTMVDVIEEDDRRRLLDSGVAGAELAARMLQHYFAFYASTYGRRCAPCHDALAVGLALGDVEAQDAPRVAVVVDQGPGPGRGQTICDLRGMDREHRDGPGCRVVLSLREPFVPCLVQRLVA